MAIPPFLRSEGITLLVRATAYRVIAIPLLKKSIAYRTYVCNHQINEFFTRSIACSTAGMISMMSVIAASM